MLFASFLRPLMKRGTLVIVDHAGTHHTVGTGAPVVTVRFHDPALGTKLFLNPALHAGEGYMNGTLTVEDADVFAMLDLIMSNLANAHGSVLARSAKTIERLGGLIRTYNPLKRAKANVAHHYDLSSLLYERFLDADMQYSMGYFKSPSDPLEDAQTQKIDHIAKKLLLKSGMEVLDIGCGWGGLALRLHQRHGVKVTGISLSEEQIKVARARAETLGVTKAVEFRLQDYREVTGTYDRIVSVGMFEHVGMPHYRRYFRAIHNLLAGDGVALVHTIGRADGPGATDSWTHKYIFPGGYSPAMSEVVPHIERQGFYIADVEILRMQYAWTLKEWRRRFMTHRAEIEKLYDARFCRMWEFFLASAESAFRNAYHVNFQFQLCKQIDAVPFTRDYLYRD